MTLEGAFAKLARAEEHVRTIEAEYRAWGDQNPEPFTHEQNPDRTEHRFYVAFNTEPDLMRWAVIGGEGVHALRSALDHCMWEAAQIESLPDERRREFPIFKDRPEYLARIESKLGGLQNPKVRTLLDGVQPWQAGNAADHYLWVLHELDRIDKHRTLTVLALAPRQLSYSIQMEHGDPILNQNPTPPAVHIEHTPVENGALLFTVSTPSAPVQVEMNHKIHIGIGLAFEGVIRGGLTGTLQVLCKQSRGKVEQFRDCLI